jgi:superfamily II DNA or RNA helicase
MLSRMKFTGTWREYQARVLEELSQHFGDERLHVVAAPGAGKTVLGLEIIRRIARPALVLAPTVAIRDQWANRLCPLFLSQPPGSEEISRHLAQPGQLTVTTYQALDAVRRAGSFDELIATLDGRGPVTLVFDEAHHLRREWWKCLEELAASLTNPRIVALTATPPYDASFAEWARYASLCGPIDHEIGIPELVRNGDLCPHQDHVILSEPTADALRLLEDRRRAIAGIAADLAGDEILLDQLQAHPWLSEPETHVEAILEAPEVLSAILVLLASAGRDLPRAPLALLGVSARDVPAPSLFWLERFLDAVTRSHQATFPLGPDRLRALRSRLHREGLIEGGQVRLRQTRSIFQLMASSLSKLESIVAIARAEQASLGPELRMVVLSDHIRLGELPASASAEFRPAKLGVVPIFETLRRAGIDEPLGVLTGTLVILPRPALPVMDEIAAEHRLAPSAFKVTDIAACPDHVRVESTTGGTSELVRLVTEMFVRGAVRILVGTQSLLGEGWDAPALNSLVLASNTSSFMLSNQMRGRAIRMDPARPEKVSNIWHLATIEPESATTLSEAVAFFDWGNLNDDGIAGQSDIALLQRRFLAFEGISNGASTLIESGIGRLGVDPAHGSEAANRSSFAIAADRPGIARRWSESLGEGNARSRVRETAAPRYAPRQLAVFDTLHALGWSALSGGAVAGASELRQVESTAQIATIGMVAAGAATVAMVPKLVKAARLAWRNGSVEGNLAQVGQVVLDALHRAGIVSEADAACGRFTVRSSIDGRRDIVLSGVKRSTERQVMEAVAEVLGPIRNPRYLLVRKSRILWRMRADYHAVPTALGARKEWAECFAELWSGKVGSSRLVFARQAEGRRVLLRARAGSFTAGFQRSVDRRSAWL